MPKLQRTWAAWRGMPSIVRFGILLALGILVLLTLPKDAFAEDRIARQGSNEVTITERPCTVAEVLIHIDKLAPGQREQFQRADATFGGKRYFACWRASPRGIHLVYEDGDQGMVPLADFKPVLSI